MVCNLSENIIFMKFIIFCVCNEDGLYILSEKLFANFDQTCYLETFDKDIW